MLSTFSGVERFNAATRLLDATLLHHLKDRPATAARNRIINRYLAKFSKEYQMAKKDLAAVPATRSEVVALGLALREISLTLDHEIEEFRSSGAAFTAEQNAALSSAVQATRNRVEEAITHMNGELKKVSARIEKDVNASADKTLRATSTNLNNRLESELETMSEAQKRVNETAAATAATRFATIQRRVSIQNWLVAISLIASVIAIWK